MLIFANNTESPKNVAQFKSGHMWPNNNLAYLVGRYFYEIMFVKKNHPISGFNIG